jgi:transcriptional regulator with XRE-family HTH domain
VTAPPKATAAPAAPVPLPFGALLRRGRQGRGWSQMRLAEEAETSARHLSCLETGRALPSREMLLRLAERLAVPLRERNAWLMAAGYAPMFRQRGLDDPALAQARRAVDRVLLAHEPWPALALDRHWNIVAMNAAVAPLLAGLPAELLVPPVNVMRLSLHPQGLAPRVANLAQWRHHLLQRLHQQAESAHDPVLDTLLDELQAMPVPASTAGLQLDDEHAGLLLPMLLHTEAGPLRLISTTTVFGAPVDLVLQELAIETLFPADEATADVLRAWALQRQAATVSRSDAAGEPLARPA